MPQDPQPLPPLRVGALIAQSFRLLGANFRTLFPLAFVPALILAVLGWLAGPVPSGDPGTLPMAPVTVSEVLVGLLAVLVSYFVMGFMSLAALDAVLGKRHTVAEYSEQTLRHLAPIVVFALLLSVALAVGVFLLVVPALYVASRYFPWVPVVVFENAGWSGLGRASELTAGYRWPLVGLVLLLAVLVVASSLLLGPLAIGLGGSLPGVIFEAVVTGLYYALIAILTALVYARLRAIKEGLTIPEIAALID